MESTPADVIEYLNTASILTARGRLATMHKSIALRMPTDTYNTSTLLTTCCL